MERHAPMPDHEYLKRVLNVKAQVIENGISEPRSDDEAYNKVEEQVVYGLFRYTGPGVSCAVW